MQREDVPAPLPPVWLDPREIRIRAPVETGQPRLLSRAFTPESEIGFWRRKGWCIVNSNAPRARTDLTSEQLAALAAICALHALCPDAVKRVLLEAGVDPAPDKLIQKLLHGPLAPPKDLGGVN